MVWAPQAPWWAAPAPWRWWWPHCAGAPDPFAGGRPWCPLAVNEEETLAHDHPRPSARPRSPEDVDIARNMDGHLSSLTPAVPFTPYTIHSTPPEQQARGLPGRLPFISDQGISTWVSQNEALGFAERERLELELEGRLSGNVCNYHGCFQGHCTREAFLVAMHLSSFSSTQMLHEVERRGRLCGCMWPAPTDPLL